MVTKFMMTISQTSIWLDVVWCLTCNHGVYRFYVAI